MQLQEQYRETYLIRWSQETKLSDFNKELQKRIAIKKDLEDKWEDKPFVWCGDNYSSLDNALADFERARFNYGKAVKAENLIYEELVKKNLTDEEIEKIVTEGTYVKFVPKK